MLEIKRTSDGLFTRHPRSTGETYLEHLRFASYSGFRLLIAGLACIIHSLLPFLFTTTASQTIEAIQHQLNMRKNKCSLTNEQPD